MNQQHRAPAGLMIQTFKVQVVLAAPESVELLGDDGRRASHAQCTKGSRAHADMAEQDRTSASSRRLVHHCRTTSFSDELEEVASAHTVQRQDQETSRVTVPAWSSPSRIWATNTEGHKLGDEPPDAIGVQNVQWRTSTRSTSRQALNGFEPVSYTHLTLPTICSV